MGGLRVGQGLVEGWARVGVGLRVTLEIERVEQCMF